MKRTLVVITTTGLVLGLAVFAFLHELAGPAPLAAAPRGAVFDDVVVIEPGSGRKAHQRIVIEDSEIVSISSVAQQGHGPSSRTGGSIRGRSSTNKSVATRRVSTAFFRCECLSLCCAQELAG